MYSKEILGLILTCLVFSKALAEIECPSEGIIFIPAENCTQYYICADGEEVLMTCPTGFYFNPAVNECDFELNVPDCDGGTRPPPTGASTITPTVSSTMSTVISTSPETYTTSMPSTSSTQKPPIETLRNCGETIVGNEGFIEYKLNEEYFANQKCSFIIRSLNHSAFIFTLEEHGIVEDPSIKGGPINIFSFGTEGLLDTVHLGPPNPLPQAYVSGSTIVVVFRTGDYLGTGFRLRFEGTGVFNGESFRNWDDIVRSDVPGSLDYPLSGSFYEDNTLSLFVVSNNHSDVVSLYETLQIFVTYADFDICGEGCECDFLTIYSFTGDSMQQLERLCSDPVENSFITKGIFILAFRSDSGISMKNGGGFSVEWKIVESFF